MSQRSETWKYIAGWKRKCKGMIEMICNVILSYVAWCGLKSQLNKVNPTDHTFSKIADFGLSNVFDEKHFLQTFCGSPLYASPEIVKGQPYYGPEVSHRHTFNKLQQLLTSKPLFVQSGRLLVIRGPSVHFSLRCDAFRRL